MSIRREQAFQGGAYVVGSARAFQYFVGQFAAGAKVVAFVPEYGVAPEHPYRHRALIGDRNE